MHDALVAVVAKWHSSDPDIGSHVFAQYADPAMADKVVHFVGRQRGTQPLPSAIGHLTTQQRLESILRSKQLYGFQVPRSQGIEVACMSDLSSAELEAAFARGLNTRGAVEPWAIAFYRTPTWLLGFRPVLYIEWSKIAQQRAALSEMYGPGWNALAVPTEMSDAGDREDWTSEREWRFCFAPGARTASGGTPGIGIQRGVAAVIVGQPGWLPPYPVRWPPESLPPERWLWDPAQQRLVHDGRVAVW